MVDTAKGAAIATSDPVEKGRLPRLSQVLDEMRRQDRKWGVSESRLIGPLVWNAILGEEVGEVCEALLEHDEAGLRTELVQVAAVALAFAGWLDAHPGAVKESWSPHPGSADLVADTIRMLEAASAAVVGEDPWPFPSAKADALEKFDALIARWGAERGR